MKNPLSILTILLFAFAITISSCGDNEAAAEQCDSATETVINESVAGDSECCGNEKGCCSGGESHSHEGGECCGDETGCCS